MASKSIQTLDEGNDELNMASRSTHTLCPRPFDEDETETLSVILYARQDQTFRSIL